MSTAHYSKCLLNTYSATPYFRAHMPVDYPLIRTLQKGRAFRRLPPNLRELSKKAKEWAKRAYAPDSAEKATGIEGWYDDDGYELNPDNGKRLTDAQIDADWERLDPDGELEEFEVEDIRVPDGGFTDPSTWEEPGATLEEEEYGGPDEDRVLSEIRARGRDYVARYYGVEPVDDDGEMARSIVAAVRVRRAS